MRLQVCYRLYPHQKKNDYEKLIEDLKSQKEQLERERGNQFTENDILEFVADLLQGDPADKDYQKKLIDNLVVKVFVGDGYITAHIKLGNATEVADIRLEEVKKALEHIFNSVQTLSPLAHRLKPQLNSIMLYLFNQNLYDFIDSVVWFRFQMI